MPTTKIGTRISGPSIVSPPWLCFAAIGAAGQIGLQRLKLGIDLVAVAKLGDLIIERARRRAKAERIGLALGKVRLPLEQVEAREGVLGLRPRIHFAKAAAILRAFDAGHDRVLAGARLAQLGLQLGDIGLGGAQRVVEHLDLHLELIGHVGRLLLLEERRLGEILAVLAQRELGLLDPIVLKPVELADLPAHLLLVGDGARRRGADLDQGLLHLHDDHADHLGGVFGLVEQVGDVGGDDVARPRKNSHGKKLLGIDVRPAPGRAGNGPNAAGSSG